jgi:hypothetical protein
MVMHNHGQKVDGWATTLVFLGTFSHYDEKRGEIFGLFFSLNLKNLLQFGKFLPNFGNHKIEKYNLGGQGRWARSPSKAPCPLRMVFQLMHNSCDITKTKLQWLHI